VVSLAAEGKAKIKVLFICQVFCKIFLQIIFARAQKSPAGGQGWGLRLDWMFEELARVDVPGLG